MTMNIRVELQQREKIENYIIEVEYIQNVAYGSANDLHNFILIFRYMF